MVMLAFLVEKYTANITHKLDVAHFYLELTIHSTRLELHFPARVTNLRVAISTCIACSVRGGTNNFVCIRLLLKYKKTDKTNIEIQ